MHHMRNLHRNMQIGLYKGITLLLSFVLLIASFFSNNSAIIAKADDGNTVSITVNYVYDSNKSMVAQPYRAQIEKNSDFKKNLEVPKLFNYSIPSDMATGLSDNIVLSKNETTGAYLLKFDLSSVDKDITVTLYYKAGTAKYTVYHYYQNLENNEYTDVKPVVVELEGDIDAYTQAVAQNKPGYHCKGIPQTTIAADGTTKVEIYYDRNYYTVTFDVNGGINGPEPIYAKYGTNFEARSITEPSRKGYIFLGWQPILADTVAVEGNVTYTAQWQPEKGQADYTVVLWGQNANDDEYSYLSSHNAWGNVGKEITWNEDTLISHVHTDDCWKLTCEKKQHTHTVDCYICGHAPGHALRPDCFGLPADTKAVDPNNNYGDNDARTHFEDECNNSSWGSYTCKGLKQYLKNGSVCQYKDGTRSGLSVSYKYYYFFYLNGQYYEISDTQYNRMKSNTGKSVVHGNDTYYVYEGSSVGCTHIHTDACYTCGKVEHTHNNSCGLLICGLSDTPQEFMRNIKPDSDLWEFDHSDTVTVNADGSSVLNVYFKRTEFTLTFAYGRNSSQTEKIIDRWGTNVKSRFDAIEAKAREYNSKLSGWKDSTTSYYTNNVMVMPKTDKTFTAHYENSSKKNTMTYYAADLGGTYQKIFEITFYGNNYTVTEDEYYEWEGFEINKEKSTKTGAPCQNATFYYDRKSYKLEFYSASNSEADRTHEVKYADSLSRYDYKPINKPSTVESDAVFVGWYLNPERTGEQYDLGAHTMPSHNIALYAKWVNGLYTVKTFTDETMQTLYTYEGYDGKRDKIEKYTLATAPIDPKKDGYLFIGWFYQDDETEKPFSFTMPITRDYDLYPKFSEPTMVEYTVHYYKAGTTERVASDRINSVMIGTTVTEKAKMGTELDLLPADKQKNYYPTNTGTSIIINRIDQEIIFYYTEASSMQYTVYYQDANGKDLIEPKTKSTEYSTVTEQYVPIANYAPRKFSITQDLSSDMAKNKIIFIYDPTLTALTIQKSGWDEIDENHTFLFHIKGNDENTKCIELTVAVHGNGKTTINDLPIGSYTVTEKSSWSWRYCFKSVVTGLEYTNVSNGAIVTLKTAQSDNQVTFKNTRVKKEWLDGDSLKVNKFN